MTTLFTAQAALAGALAQPSEGAAAAAAEAGGSTLLEYIQSAGVVGLVLIVLSIVAVAMVIASLVQLQRGRMAPLDTIEELDVMISQGRIADASALCENDDRVCSLTRVLGPALKRCRASQFGFLEIRAAIEEAGQKELERLFRPIDLIGLAAAVGPMLGLLGTVIGMIGAFGTIGQMEGATRSQQLAMFMSMALVATAMGLSVAIPCTILYSVLRKRAEALMGELGEVLDEWIGRLEPSQAGGQPSAVASAHRAPAPPQPRPRPAPIAPSANGGPGVPRRVEGAGGQGA